MTEPTDSNASRRAVFAITVVVLLLFALLTTVLLSQLRVRSAIDRTEMGVFDEETVQNRWDNLAATQQEQSELYAEGEVRKAMDELLQEASGEADPEIYLNMVRQVGHGAGTRRSDTVDRYVRLYSFIERFLGRPGG